MRKQWLASMYFAAVLVCGTGMAFAQHEGPYLNVELGPAIVQDINGNLQDINANFPDVPGKLKFDTGLRLGINPGYTLYSSPTYEAAVQLDTGVIYNSARKVSSDFGDSSVDGDLFQVPVLANIIYTFAGGTRFVPYLGVGGGGVYHRLNIDAIDGYPVGALDDGFDPAFQAMVGLRFKIDPRNELGVGYKFLATFASETFNTHAVSLVYVLRF